jgi:hypothetical protein
MADGAPDVDDQEEQRRLAAAILRRSPVDFSRRASYGEEHRTEVVLVEWSDGRRSRLEQSRDERISFALRDRFEAARPACRDQLQALIPQHGTPDAVAVAWRYVANWEGEPPINQSGRYRFTWREVAALLGLPADVPQR